MDETIGARGGKNDRRRVLKIKKKQEQKLQELSKEEKLKELEKEVRKKQTYTLIKTLPLVLLGGTIKTIVGWDEKENDLEQEKKFIVSDYEAGIQPKGDAQTKIITTKEGNRVRVFVPRDKNNILDLISVSNKPVHKVSLTQNDSQKDGYQHTTSSERTDGNAKDNQQKFSFGNIPIDYGFPLQFDTQKKLHDLKSRKLIEAYEKELKNIRYDLRQLIFEYNVIVSEKDAAVLSEDVQMLIDRLSYVIKKLGDLKNRINIEDLDKYDADYIYILIEDYLDEFRNGKIVSELKDSPFYILISEKLDELDKAKDKLSKRLDEKKEQYEDREEDFDKLKERYYKIDKINESLEKFQDEQEKLLIEIRNKISNSVSVTERVEVQFAGMNLMSLRLLRLMALQMFIPGIRSVIPLSMAATMYMQFMRNVIDPQTTTRRIQVVRVEDYSKQIENNIEAIEDASKLLNKTSVQIDKMIDDIKDQFKDYIGVVQECDELLANLSNIKMNLKEKEYEIEIIKDDHEKELERNNARVLRRGEYPM